MANDLLQAEQDAAALGAFDAFRGVGAGLRLELARDAIEHKVSAGEVVLRHGESNRCFFLVMSGQLGVFLEGLDAEPVTTLGAGQTFGELSLLDEAPVSASVIALEPARVLAIDDRAFWNLVNESHAFAVSLLLKLSDRLRANSATVSANVKERRRYEHAALFDGLTGIHNRRWLDDALPRLIQRFDRAPTRPLCLALIDVDHFKRFNDRFGHHAGDQVLVLVARTLNRCLRPTDFSARLGGEELVVLLPDTPRTGAAVVAERIRETVAAEQTVLADGTVLPAVTLSIGVAELAPGQNAAALLEAADQAMYRAKQAGRNRVELA